MKKRMQPIGPVWSKLPRLVCDLAAMCGKKVRIELEGKETEVDKTMAEAIEDSLVHIVRNSVDHGIETPEVRAAQNKPEEGVLKIRAYHEGGQVNIEISDDGVGIDATRIRQKCLRKGLINPRQAARMSDDEALQLIFLPGFSTAGKIAKASGSGAGMDAVKTMIEKIGGTVDLQSRPGQGTTIKIKVPFTLAIIPALLVTSGGGRFAIPQVNVLELLRLDCESSDREIEFIDEAPVYRLRGQLLPLAYLNRELELDPTAGLASAVINIVVLHADGHPFGLVVDEINDTEEIVVKPLGKQLKGDGSFAGTTTTSDGRVALILDVIGLAQRAGVVAEVRDRSLLTREERSIKAGKSFQTLILFKADQGTRLAIPLSMVARLEEFPRSAIEHPGAQDVVRYRGQVMPLIRVSDYVPAVTPAATLSDPMQVVVYSENHRSVGLVVGEINEIVQDVVTIRRHSRDRGILGSVVIQDRVTDLLDVKTVIRAAAPHFFSATTA